MHVRKLVSVAAVGALVLSGLFAQGAMARKHRSFGGRCAVSIHVAPHRIVAGDPVVVFGRLRCVHPAERSGQTVRLYHHLVGLPGFTYVQSVTTDSAGFYELSRADGVVETNRAWFVRSHGAQSSVVHVDVAAQVTLSGPPESQQLLTGFANRVTFTGTVSPADAGARVILQRQNATTGTQWHRIDSGVVGLEGAFTIVHTFIVPGDANIRVLVRSQGRNIPSPSDVLAYVISQAQNPALTIAASADPIAFGESVLISGKLEGGAGQPVTLLARTARQHGFMKVAEVTTNSSGEYSFPAQSPVNSTFYEVTGLESACPPPAPGKPTCDLLAAVRRIKSAVLYEGVKDVLTAQVSATSIPAGSTVVFSGTVVPDHTGHVIYLERRNASGNGYHVVEIATVGAGSTYSISHRVYDTGSKVFRVYIPGGPENQGAASQPFTIEVTPAPASALTPEPQSNTSVPAEGQT
jgi:hypothetical protein